jgi:lipopolysaccharide assembly outer membrane protein LptD (OstA)
MKKSSFLFSLAIALSSASAFAGQDVESTSKTIISSAQDPVPVVKSFARDSTKYSADRKVVSLFGDAKIMSKNVAVIADEIVYDATAKTLKIKNLQSLMVRNKEQKGKLERSSLTLKLTEAGYDVVK